MARLLGGALLALIFYAMASALVFLASLVLLQKGTAPDLPWIAQVQERLYFDGMRNIWQAQSDCVVFDDDLIFKPKDGACTFNNVEFRTVLNYSAEGRFTGPKPKGVGIAVLGDSHAAGWGVGDEETFSAELQRLSGRPVYNLAVSGYGTPRELIRMAKSGLLDKVDTIIIQYCDNDLEENMAFSSGSVETVIKKFNTITQGHELSFIEQLKFLNKAYWFTFRAPFSILKKRLYPKKDKNFSQHYPPLISVLGRFEILKSKRVIVFYSNGHGRKFSGFPAGKVQQLPNVEFADLNFDTDDYYRIDDHLTQAGHQKAAQQLFALIRP